MRIKHLTKSALHVLQNLGRFAWENKIWWMFPLVLVLGLLAFVVFSGQAVTPFVYTLW